MNRSPLNFSFPPRRHGHEPGGRQRQLLTLALLLLAVHGAVLLLAPAHRRPGATGAERIPAVADDTPQLLRLSRATGEPARLATVPLGDLPPPPPSPLPIVGATAPQARQARQAPRPSPDARGPGLPPPALPSRLADAVAGLRSLQRITPGQALTAAERDLLVALQRRQVWLASAQDAQAERLWQRATAVTDSLPAELDGLPEGADLRRLAADPPPELVAGDGHGQSLVGREATLLLWRQAGRLWLLRLPIPREPARSTDAEKTLTSS